MTKILVAGGAGYIGSHTAMVLAEAGYQPVVYDNLSYGHEWAVQWGPLERGDLADGDRLRDVIREHQVEAVIHLAAFIQVGESVKAPSKYYRNNFLNTLNLLEAMIDTGVRDIIFSSTAATYGMPEHVPIPETAPQIPINPYGESKLFVERALRAFEAAHGMRSVIFRYFNAAGADPAGRIGEDHSPETHLIPLVIQAALGQRPNIQVFGNDYATRDGTAVRDYVHVLDLGEAHRLGMEHLRRGGDSLALNLGTGKGYTVREVIHAVERAGGRPVPVVEGPRREGDSERLVADSSRAQALLNWTPRHSSLEEIVETAWRWHSSRA